MKEGNLGLIRRGLRDLIQSAEVSSLPYATGGFAKPSKRGIMNQTRHLIRLPFHDGERTQTFICGRAARAEPSN